MGLFRFVKEDMDHVFLLLCDGSQLALCHVLGDDFRDERVHAVVGILEALVQPLKVQPFEARNEVRGVECAEAERNLVRNFFEVVELEHLLLIFLFPKSCAQAPVQNESGYGVVKHNRQVGPELYLAVPRQGADEVTDFLSTHVLSRLTPLRTPLKRGRQEKLAPWVLRNSVAVSGDEATMHCAWPRRIEMSGPYFIASFARSS